jgi:hypothetical protein
MAIHPNGAVWVRTRLAGGDRRSIGRVPEVINAVRRDDTLFHALAKAMDDPDSVVAMRACDAVEKLTAADASALRPWVGLILQRLARRPEAEIRWHVAQLLPRLALTSLRRKQIRRILSDFSRDESRIVRVFAMQAMWDIGRSDPVFSRDARKVAKKAIAAGPPALRARARKLLSNTSPKRRKSL